MSALVQLVLPGLAAVAYGHLGGPRAQVQQRALRAVWTVTAIEAVFVIWKGLS